MNRFLLLAVVLSTMLGACSKKPCNVDTGAGQMDVPGTPGDFERNVMNKAFFDFDSWEILPTAYHALDAQSKWMNMYTGTHITVEGNADERGTGEFNIGLGLIRAQSVKDYLVASGVAQERIKVVSFGKNKPECVNAKTEADHAKNRRTVTVVTMPS
jgi:peptidoglycan-associated lipoprotein